MPEDGTPMKHLVTLLMLAFALAAADALAASDRAEIDALLDRSDAPPGVVIEVVSGADALAWAVPRIQDYVVLLRERWPALDIAVVSHGREQFALMHQESQAQAAVHEGVKSLVNEQSVPVHVCGTYAGWRGIAAEDFPDYVDVAAAGPAQINDYRALGYELVVIRGR
jgi:intracellular sulfur oxidation DsrE/DsrF family protein